LIIAANAASWYGVIFWVVARSTFLTGLTFRLYFIVVRRSRTGDSASP
jgi:hypothetical protein